MEQLSSMPFFRVLTSKASKEFTWSWTEKKMTWLGALRENNPQIRLSKHNMDPKLLRTNTSWIQQLSETMTRMTEYPSDETKELLSSKSSFRDGMNTLMQKMEKMKDLNKLYDKRVIEKEDREHLHNGQPLEGFCSVREKEFALPLQNLLLVDPG